MLGTSEGSFYLLSKLWKKSPQTGFYGHGHEHFFVQSRAKRRDSQGLRAECVVKRCVEKAENATSHGLEGITGEGSFGRTLDLESL